jgi:hypothetical protein
MMKINRFPTKQYHSHEIGNDDCLICMEKILGEEAHNRILECDKCKIFYHFDCIVNWLYGRDIYCRQQCCHCRSDWSNQVGFIKLA